jgi:hypothetical protein
MANVAQTSNGSECPACRTVIVAGARFCHKCGTPAGGPAAPPRQQWKLKAALIVSAALWVLVVVFLGVRFAQQEGSPVRNPHANLPATAQPPRQPVDLSSMTPREAADRLFNRVMAANENGNVDEARQFAPMALQAYGLVDQLDADARYHIALIHLVVDDVLSARGEIEVLLDEAPDHLLGLIVLSDIAGRTGDAAAAASVRERFINSYESQISSGRQEYEAHRVTIDAFRASAQSAN